MTNPWDDWALHEQEFYKLFIEFINSFNQFDTNLGIFLCWFITGGQPDLAFPIVCNFNTQKKIDTLREIINGERFEKQSEMVDEFNKWIKIATKAKCRRNDYVHGRWWFHPNVESEKYIHYESLNINAKKHEEFSLAEFKDVVDQMNKLQFDLDKLRNRYLRMYEFGRSMPEQPEQISHT
jgi:hypothetical protein